MGGGIILGEGDAKEAITGNRIDVPKNVDEWTEPEIFGQHLITRVGVNVDKDLRCQTDSSQAGIKNIFFAGRTIGDYDYATEKSGHGVAIATGWKAGKMAAAQAGCNITEMETAGE